jgi:lysophospholipase L1-like esterase
MPSAARSGVRSAGADSRNPAALLVGLVSLVAVGVAACAAGTPGASGSGGTTGAMGTGGGSGGTEGSGGNRGSGGAALQATGGTNGSGGMSSSGGSSVTGNGSGGNSSSTGGAPGSGGSPVATGGATGTGSGGAKGSGGSDGAGGGRGGATASGGRNGTGGSQGTDGGAPDGSTDLGSGDAGGAGTAYMPCPTTSGTACVVLPLGDSITEGCCTAPEGGYRIQLFSLAVMNHKNLTFGGSLTNGPPTVQNKTFPNRHEGHGGYTISGGGNGGIAGTITDSALSTYHPHIVLLKIGTNDINGNIDVANAPNRLGSLIDEIVAGAPSALVVVSSIIPTRDTNTNQKVKTYNAAIPGLVNSRAAAGKHVVFVDNYAAFAQNANYSTALMADGLHPNDAGYQVLGQSFYGVIGPLLPAAP